MRPLPASEAALSEKGKGCISTDLGQPPRSASSAPLWAEELEQTQLQRPPQSQHPSWQGSWGPRSPHRRNFRGHAASGGPRGTGWIIPLTTGKHGVAMVALGPPSRPPAPCHSIFGNREESAPPPNKTGLRTARLVYICKATQWINLGMQRSGWSTGVSVSPRGGWGLVGWGGGQGQEKDQHPARNGGSTSRRGKALQKCDVS